MAANIITRMVTDTKAHDQGLEKAKASVDKYMKSANSADGIAKSLLSTFGKYASVMGAVSAAFKVVNDAFIKAETNVDSYTRSVESAKSAYEVFCASLRNGDWGNFFNNLQNAVSGAKDLYNALDDLGTFQLASSVDFASIERDRNKNKLDLKQGTITQAEYDQREKSLAEREKNLIKRESDLTTNSAMMSLYSGGEDLGIDKSYLNRLTSGDLGIRSIDEAKAKEAELAAQIKDLERQKVTRSASAGSYSIAYGGGMSSADKANDEAVRANNARLQSAIDSLKQEKLFYNYMANPDNFEKAQQAYKLQAQAISREGQMYRNQLRADKSGKGGKTTATTSQEAWQFIDYTPQGLDLSGARSIATIEADLRKWQEAYRKAGDEGGRAYADSMIKSIKENLKFIQNEGVNPLEEISKNIEIKPYKSDFGEQGKEASDNWNKAAEAMNNVGSAMSNIEDPSARVTGIMMEAIANVMLSFAQATSKSSNLGVFGWIAAATAGLATAISVASQMKAATQYAEGGVVGGNSFEGDRLYARVNSGETILNSRQAGILNQALDNRGGGSVVRGEDIILAVNNTAKRKGLGELVFA